jgi:hypothetical protein
VEIGGGLCEAIDVGGGNVGRGLREKAQVGGAEVIGEESPRRSRRGKRRRNMAKEGSRGGAAKEDLRARGRILQ